jgi:hypothetical protein
MTHGGCRAVVQLASTIKSAIIRIAVRAILAASSHSP